MRAQEGAWYNLLPDHVRAAMRESEVGCGRLVLHAVGNAVEALSLPPQSRARTSEELSILAVAIEGSTPRTAAFLAVLSAWLMEPVLKGELLSASETEVTAFRQAAQTLLDGGRHGPALVVAHCGLAWAPQDEGLRQLVATSRAGLSRSPH